MILVFDTETTGKADFRAPIQAAHQPHMVQLGAQLLSDKFEVCGEINLIVKPNGWTIPEEASKIHGITQEVAMNFGLDSPLVAEIFREFVNRAHVLVAHNFSFDSLIIGAHWHRVGMDSKHLKMTK